MKLNQALAQLNEVVAKSNKVVVKSSKVVAKLNKIVAMFKNKCKKRNKTQNKYGNGTQENGKDWNT